MSRSRTPSPLDRMSEARTDDSTMSNIDWGTLIGKYFPGRDLLHIMGLNDPGTFAQTWWRKRPAEYLRKSVWHEEKGPFERTHSDNAAVAKITESLPINHLAFYPPPAWVMLQLFWFFNLLNGLHKLLRGGRWSEVSADGEHFVDPDEFITSAMNLVDILVSGGGIELIKHHPFPIGGPGARWEDVEGLLGHYFFRYDFPAAQLRGQHRRIWKRVETVARKYVEVLKKYKPSHYLALTSGAAHVRYAEWPYVSSGYENRHFPMYADSRRLEPQRATMGPGPCSGEFKTSLWRRLRRMVDDLNEWYLTNAPLDDWKQIEVAIQMAGHPGSKNPYELPPPFRSTDKCIVTTVVRNGGCPKKVQAGCSSGTLRGEGWMSLLHMLDMEIGFNFWDGETNWAWDEDGSGSSRPGRYNVSRAHFGLDDADFGLPPDEPPSPGAAESVASSPSRFTAPSVFSPDFWDDDSEDSRDSEHTVRSMSSFHI